MYLIVKESPTLDIEIVAKCKNRMSVIRYSKRITTKNELDSLMVIKADSLTDFVKKST